MAKKSLGSRLADHYRNKSFVFWDFVILVVAVALFFIGWFGITRGSNVFVSGSFYTEGFKAVYNLEGKTAEELGGDRLEVETVESDDETATIEVKVDSRTDRLVLDRKTAKVLEDARIGLPLVFFYDICREPYEESATFGEDITPEFSTEFTGLDGEVFARVEKKNSDNAVMWYHTTDEGSDYGPQFSWELDVFQDDGTKVGTIVNDITSGLLINARFYQDGWGEINLAGTNYPTGANRWAVFIGLNIILAIWGIFHLLRVRRHREEWEKHWSYFPLNFVGISRFYVRLMAFTTFGFLGMGVLTGNITLLLITDLIGLALMIYAVGLFAFPVLFQFIPWIAAFGVFAGGRPIDYVQYPFGVLLYLTAVVTYELYRYMSHRNREQDMKKLADRLPQSARKAVLEELEADEASAGREATTEAGRAWALRRAMSGCCASQRARISGSAGPAPSAS